MAKVSAEAKKKYFDKIKTYKKEIEDILQRETLLLNMSSEEEGLEFRKLTLADESLNLVSYYLILDSLSVSLLGVKNDAFMNNARKACYKAIIYLEQVVTNYIDAPFGDYEENLIKIESVSDRERLKLVSKIGFAIESVIDAYGDNSKWRWSFVELEGRFATVIKNLLDLRKLPAKLDPRYDDYQIVVQHLNLARQWMVHSADRYREKYEMSTHRIDDFKTAIKYLEALRRLSSILRRPKDVDEFKRRVDIWSQKMEADRKAQEKRSQ
ncbi:hypothetical protein [Spirochaeta cellobiosiphila]|uniref:hypothetical protein n=1 Tax=Spirochaeta cellobiosiphila TaxID=504483 RepID=UPI0003FA1C82|nr:hypothetical protein [Spirochaeta cellobiosiphila]